MESLTNSVRLRVHDFRLCMLDVIESKIKLVVVRLSLATELSASVGKDANHPHTLFGKEGQHQVVEQVCRGNRRLGRIQLGSSPLRVGINKGLLVDTAYALQCAYVESILAS